MNDEATEIAVLESVKAFKTAGGGCLVENSTFGINRKSGYLKKLSQETGVNVIAGTGNHNVFTVS
jgi:phosphotriesterase-related protein